jgi:hypothetical protein
LTPEDKVHDLHPMIRPSGLYWVTDVPAGGLEVAPDGRSATLRLRGVAGIDQPRWPAPDADARRATLDITVHWKATDEEVRMDDAAKQFRFTGWKAVATAEARLSVPSIGFTWRSAPADTSTAAFAIIGEESNGKYYGG